MNCINLRYAGMKGNLPPLVLYGLTDSFAAAVLAGNDPFLDKKTSHKIEKDSQLTKTI